MTPKEKATKLIHKYVDLTDGWVYGVESWEYKKRCALIAVEEIKTVLQNTAFLGETFIYTLKYWEEVKQEIEKL